MEDQPGDGEIYLASDGWWYRWPNPTPYSSRAAAEARDAWAVTATPAVSSEPSWPAWYRAPVPPPTGVARATAYLAALFVGGPILGGAIGWAVLPHDVERGCEGIGFGCTLSSADTAIFVAVYALLFTVPGVAISALMMRGLTSVWPWYRELRALAKAVVFLAGLAAPLVLIRLVGILYYALLD
jgi:hypothetical protein